MSATIRFEPLLECQRRLLDLPIGRERFLNYLEVMGRLPDGSVKLPLTLVNPMAKDHVTEMLDRLIDSGAEEVAAEATARAAERMSPRVVEAVHGLDLKVTVVVVDDAMGGWTDRVLSDFSYRFLEPGRRHHEIEHGWITTVLWSGDPYSPGVLAAATAAAIYRAFYVLEHGGPRSLDEMMRQEGRAAWFGDVRYPDAAEAAVDDTANILAAYRSSTARPVQVAALWGDDAAEASGYDTLGVVAWGGLALARAEAQKAHPDLSRPESLLRPRARPF